MPWCNLRLTIALLFLAGCATTPKEAPSVDREVPFQYVAKTFISIPVRLNNKTTRNFALDTGAGITAIATSLCPEFGCAPHGEQSGKRMSGQELKLPLTTMRSLSVGGHEQKDMP